MLPIVFFKKSSYHESGERNPAAGRFAGISIEMILLPNLPLQHIFPNGRSL